MSIKNSTVLALTVELFRTAMAKFQFLLSVVLLGDMIPQPLIECQTISKSNCPHSHMWVVPGKRTKGKTAALYAELMWAEVKSQRRDVCSVELE